MGGRTLTSGPDKRVPPRKADVTSTSLRGNRSEGHACRARCKGMDNPTSNDGPDRQVPPKGRRGTLVVPDARGMDNPTSNDGPDRQVPPEKVPPRLQGPFINDPYRLLVAIRSVKKKARTDRLCEEAGPHRNTVFASRRRSEPLRWHRIFRISRGRFSETPHPSNYTTNRGIELQLQQQYRLPF